MTEQVKTLAELKNDADDLGVVYAENTGAKKLKALIAEANLLESGGSLDVDTDTDADEPADEPQDDEPQDNEPAAHEPTPKPRKTKAMTYVNKSTNVHNVGGTDVVPGAVITITKAEQSDKSFMAKLATSIRCNILVEVK